MSSNAFDTDATQDVVRRRKRGGQPGNRNRFKTGLHSKSYRAMRREMALLRRNMGLVLAAAEAAAQTGDTGYHRGMPVLRVTPGITLDESELEERFVLSSGPGGQNVNNVASAVELRFDAAHSPSLSEDVRARLRTLAGRRMTKDGILVLHGNRFRDQQRNREDVRARLIDLIARAAVAPKPRKRTKPSRAAKEKRLQEKKNRGRLKKARSKVRED